jgi:hypothetical protein
MHARPHRMRPIGVPRKCGKNGRNPPSSPHKMIMKREPAHTGHLDVRYQARRRIQAVGFQEVIRTAERVRYQSHRIEQILQPSETDESSSTIETTSPLGISTFNISPKWGLAVGHDDDAEVASWGEIG